MVSLQQDPELARAAAGYRLVLPHSPVRGRAGEMLGRSGGSSLEFQEFRQYMPGDDVRHIDWITYARTDTLMLRLYREQISPRTEILLDVSRSMRFHLPGSPPAKQQVARQLAALFAMLAGRLGTRPVVLPLGDEHPARALSGPPLDELDRLEFDAAGSPWELLSHHQVPLKARSVRILVSDFLFPHDPEALAKRLGSEAGMLWLVQVLSAWEADPWPLGGRRLVDLETHQQTDLVLSPAVIGEYLERLNGLRESLAVAARRVQGYFVTVIADHGLERLCREDLCAAGLLEPD